MTAVSVKALTAPGRYGDGDGLYLDVAPGGARTWIVRVQSNGKRRDIGLGSFKLVGLSDARTAAADIRRKVRAGIDPVQERREARLKVVAPLFRVAAKACHTEYLPTWKNDKHAWQWLASLETHAFAKLGDMPVGRVLARHKRAAVKVIGKGPAVKVESPHGDDGGHYHQMLDAFGTPSGDFMNATFAQMLNAITEKGADAPNQLAINAALAVMGGVEPANEVEALIASQMAATHSLAMMMIGRTRQADRLDQLEAQGGLAVKLLRTFTLQAEALAKLRRGGGQTVRVEHVHVHAGGQAIVGSVTPGGGAILKSEDQPHAKQDAVTHADASIDPLRSAHPQCDRVPVASDA